MSKYSSMTVLDEIIQTIEAMPSINKEQALALLSSKLADETSQLYELFTDGQYNIFDFWDSMEQAGYECRYND